MNLKIFSPKILAFFVPTTPSFCKNLIITLGFEKNANVWQKTEENCDHNFGPRPHN
jgi:hypothetical protein